MSNMNPKPIEALLIYKITKHLPLAEKILLPILAFGMVLLAMDLNSSLAITSLYFLGLIYFLFAYRPPGPEAQEGPSNFQQILSNLILPKVLWISCAVSAVALAFFFIDSEGYKQLAMIGGSSIGIGIFLFSFFLVNGIKQLDTLPPVLLRATPLFIVDIYIFLI